MTWLALDIGGAHLKAADGRGFAASRPFALWRTPERLADEVGSILDQAPSRNCLALTMTGELADCYETKADGVRAIVEAVQAAADERCVVYTTRGEFWTAEQVEAEPLVAAASNWHALAKYAVRWAHGRPALLIDIGSTTTDIIPLNASGPTTHSQLDSDRLIAGELVYTGVERTPVAAIVSRLPWRNALCPVASEFFATSADVHLVLGDLPEEPEAVDTADGRPRILSAARSRLARMICTDATMFSEADAAVAAAAVRDAQLERIEAAVGRVLARVPEQPEVLILSGHGEFLAERLLARFTWAGRDPLVLSLNKALGPLVSRCAPAHALAVLAEERLTPKRSDR